MYHMLIYRSDCNEFLSKLVNGLSGVIFEGLRLRSNWLFCVVAYLAEDIITSQTATFRMRFALSFQTINRRPSMQRRHAPETYFQNEYHLLESMQKISPTRRHESLNV